MLRRRRSDDDDDILADGQTFRTPMVLMDGFDPLQRAVASAPVAIVDAHGLPAGHRPGYAFVASESIADAARAQAFHDEGNRLRDAWRDPSAAPARQTTVQPTDGTDAREQSWLAQGQLLRDAWRAV